MRRGCVSSLPALAVIVAALSVTVHTEDERAAENLFDIIVPGGIRNALSAIEDHSPPDRSHFLLDVIRRFHDAPIVGPKDPRAGSLERLLARLRQASPAEPGTGESARETVPLPLPPHVWIDVVFNGQTTPEALAGAILQSRNASLLYYGLLSLDGPTRQWLTTERGLLGYLASRHPGTFLVAAPGLRVSGGRIRLPGGEAAEPVWRDLSGAGTNAPAEVVRAIVDNRRGRLAYFLGAVSRLSASQLGYALQLDSPDAEVRVAAARRLYAVFEDIAHHWDIEELPFWRPSRDPALLLAGMRVDERGRPVLPGSREFWSAVLAERADDRTIAAAAARARRDKTAPVDFAWLCARVFSGPSVERMPSYDAVLFASRHLERLGTGTREEIEVVRAAGRYPALTAGLERANVTDLAAFAAAARRARTLDAVADRSRALRALAQFQGLLAFIVRAAARGGVPRDSVSPLVSSLSAVAPGDKGDYEGRLVRWVDAHLMPLAERFVRTSARAGQQVIEDVGAREFRERRLLSMLSGAVSADPQFVDWEGTRYRVDLPAAEAARLASLLGATPEPFVSMALALVEVADLVAGTPGAPDALRVAADALADPGEAVSRALTKDEAHEYRESSAALQRAARTGDRRLGARQAPRLLVLADALLARGLVELAYAVALGRPDAIAIPVSEAAARHDFELADGPLPSRAWQLPDPGAWKNRPWHVRGSLLGLDVRLAQFALVRVSSRPPPRKPSLSDIDRRVFIETVRLVEPAELSDARRDQMLAALARGRARIAEVRSREDALALAGEIRLDPARRSLLAWSAVHERERVPAFFSLSEVLWLGAEASPAPAIFDPWGTSGEPRIGCLCLRLIPPGGWEILAGRWHTGTLASAFPDLNLRLTELLAELGMPAVLLGPVLAAATVDFVENVTTRHQDDRRGLTEFVRALGRERVEEYLALLTTDGPLVPVDTTEPAAAARSPR